MSDASITLQDIRESQRWHESRDVERFTETSDRLKYIVDVELSNIKRDVKDLAEKADRLEVKVDNLETTTDLLIKKVDIIQTNSEWLMRGMLAIMTGIGGLAVTMFSYLLLN